MVRLLTAHESSLKKLKAALVVFLFVPQVINNSIQQAAKTWKGQQAGPAASRQLLLYYCAFVALLEGIHNCMIASPRVLGPKVLMSYRNSLAPSISYIGSRIEA